MYNFALETAESIANAHLRALKARGSASSTEVIRSIRGFIQLPSNGWGQRAGQYVEYVTGNTDPAINTKYPKTKRWAYAADYTA